MNLFFTIVSPILFILAIVLFITARKLPQKSRTPSYLSAGLCVLVGIISIYFALVSS